MKFGIFYEHQLPRPWRDGDELRLFQEALDQVELADRLGIDFAWEVEHHFLEEYSHSSAPEVFLAACSQRTQRIRLGHGIFLMPPAYNHPAKVAEKIATLDLVSKGRVEFGTGESASRAELEGFGVPYAEKRAMWLEATEQVANMMVMDPYPGFQGKYFSMPCRNVVPKPVQKPHPPMWVACSNREMIHTAAKHGLGALTFAFVDPSEAKHWVDDYYTTLKNECVPIGHAINPNIAMVTGFSCHETRRKRAVAGSTAFSSSASRSATTTSSVRTSPAAPTSGGCTRRRAARCPTSAVGASVRRTSCARTSQAFSDVGVDQVMFIQQGGKNRHEHICESLELFAARVMPEFKANEDERQRRKMEELAPHLEAAMKRKRWMKPLADEQIEEFRAYGRAISEAPRRGAVPIPTTP